MEKSIIENFMNELRKNNPSTFQASYSRDNLPSTRDIYKQVFSYAQYGDHENGRKVYNSYMNLRNDTTSPYYNPYFQATNTQAIDGLRGLGFQIPENGISQKYIDSLKPYADYSNVSVSGSLKSPSKTSTPNQDLAYWLYQLEGDEARTQAAEAEWDEMQREIGLYVKQGYSDEDIIRKIDMNNYRTLSAMDESLNTKVPIQTTRGIGYSKDAMYGAIWAARNGGGTGNSEQDFMRYAAGYGNFFKPDEKSQAALDATSEWYNPYGTSNVVTGYNAQDAAIEYRVQYFDRDWLKSHAYMMNGSEKEVKAYATIRGYVETSEAAAEEYEKLNAWADKQISEKGYDTEKILKMLQSADINSPSKTRFEANYPTLAKMEKARSEGKALDMGFAVDFAMPYFESDIEAKVSARDTKAAEAAQATIEGAVQGNTPNKKIENFTYTGFMNEQSKKTAFEADVSKDALAEDIAAYWEGEKAVEDLSPEAQGFVEKYGEFFGGMKTWIPASGMKSQYDTRKYKLSNMNIAEERADFMGEDAYNALVGIEEAVNRGIMSGEEGAEQLFTLATVFDAAAENGIGVRDYLESTPEAQAAIASINEMLSIKEQKNQEEKTNANNILMQDYASCNFSMAIGAPLGEDQLELTMAIGSVQVDKNEESEKYNEIFEGYIQPAIQNFYASRGITDEETFKSTFANDPIMKAVSNRLSGVAFENDMKMAKYQGISMAEYYERTPSALDVYSEGAISQMYGEYENAVKIYIAKERSMYSDRNRVRIAAGEAPLDGIDEAAITQAAIEKTDKENDAQYQNEEIRESLNDKGVFTAIGLGAKHGTLGFAAGAVDAFEWYVLKRSDKALEASLRGTYSRDEYRAYLEKTIPTLKDESERKALQEQLSSYEGDIYKFGFDPRTVDTQNAVAELRNHQNEIEEYGRNHLSESELSVLNVSSSVTYNTLAMLEAAAITYASGGGAGGMFAANLAAFGAPAGAESGKKFMQAGMDYDTALGWSYIIADSAAGIEMLSDGIVSGIGKRVFNLPSQIRFAAHADAAAGHLARNYAPGFNASFASWARRAALNAGEFGANLAYKGVAEGAEEAISSVIMQAEENAILNAETGSKNALVDWEQVLNESAMGTLQGAFFGIGSTAVANRSTNQVVDQAGAKLALEENRQKAPFVNTAESFKNAKIGDLVAFFATPIDNVESNSALMQEIKAMGNVQSLSTEQAQRILDAASKDIQNEVLVQTALDVIESGKADVSAEVIQIASETIGEFNKANASAIEAKAIAETNLSKAQSVLNDAQITADMLGAQRIEAVELLVSEEIPTPETVQNKNEAESKHIKALEEAAKASEGVDAARAALQKAQGDLDVLMADFIENARTEAQQRVNARAQEAADAMAKEILAQAESVHAEVDSDIESALSAVQERYGYSRKAIADMRQEIEGYSARAAEKLQTSREKLRSDLEKRLSGWKVSYAPLGETVGGSTNAASREIVLNSNASLDELNAYVTTHELTHYAEKSGMYDELAKSVLDFAYGTNDIQSDVIQAAKADIQNEYEARTGQTLTDDAAIREMVAKAMNERVFRGTESGKWVDRLVKGNRNLALRLYDWAADQVQALYLRIRNKDGEGREAANAFKRMRELQRRFETVLDDAGVEYEKRASEEIDTEIDAENAILPDRRTQRQLEALALAADEAKEKGDTDAWKRIMEARQSLIETTGIRYEGNNPVRIAEKLAVALGGKVYTLKNAGSAYFDQHSKAIVEGKGAASALSNTMQAIGEQIAEMPEIQAISSNVDAAPFFFRYITTGNKSLSAAEEAYRMQFEKALSEAGKLKDVQLARAQMLNYINSTAAEKIETFISERYKPKTGIRAWLNQKLTENIDRTRPAQLVDSYTGGNALSVATAYLPYAKRMADRMFDEVMTDADGNVVYKGLGALFEETGLLDKDYKLLRDYLLSKHGLSRIDEGKPIFPEGDAEVDLSEAQMREVVQMVEGGMSSNPQYKRVYNSATALHSWWNAFMDTWVVGEGRLPEEDVMRMRKTYPYYVPTFREGYGIRLLGGELSDTGSKRRVYDPISSMQSMIAGVVNQVQQNRAARVFDEIYQRTPGLGWIAQETQPKVEIIETTDDDGMRSFETKVTRPSDPGTLEVIRADGSRVYYNIADEGLYNLLSRSGAKTMKTGLEMVGRATRMMAKLTTELNLLFGAKNAIRDLQHSINYGSWASNYATGLLKWLPTFFEVARGRSETLQGYKAMGGGEWERYATNTRPGTRKLRRALAKSTGISGALRRASSIPEIVLKLNEWSELTSRYVEYKYGKHDLATPEGRRDAFMAAQEATVDFQRGGDSTLARLMRQVVPFFNATVQGGYQQARMFTGVERERLAPRLAKTLINNALMGALSAGMVYALGTDEDKEKYANLSESAKNGYMIFPLFGDAEFMHMLGRPAGMDFIRLPLGQDALAREAYVFGNSLTDILMGDYESGISELASDLWGVTKDILANALPTSTVLQPIFDVQANESFYGSPIVRESTRQREHWTDWNDSTTPEIFKTASDFISRIAPNAEWAAPAYLEYMAGQWTGWMGQSVLSMLSKDYYTGEAGGMRAVAENFHKAFLFDSATTTDVRTEFDKRVTAIDRISGTTDMKTSELKPGLSEEEAKQAYIAANDLKDGTLKYVEDQISEKYDEIRQVNEGEGTDFEKEARVAQLYDEIVALEKQAVSATEEFWKKYVYGGNMFASRAYIPEVSKVYLTDEIFRADYEDGAVYMIDAETIAGLPGNENSTTIYPSPRHTMTAKDENGAQQEYALKDAKAEAEFDEKYREYYMEGYESLMDSYPGFWDDEYSDAERTTLWKKLHTHAQKMAQAEMWDEEAYKPVK